MRDYLRYAAVVALALIASMTILLAPVTSQQPFVAAQVQDNPPGGPGVSQIPFCVTVDSGGAAAATCTVPAIAGKSIFVTGFEVMGDGATGQSVILVTLAFNSVVVANYRYNVVAGATTANPLLSIQYCTPITAGPQGANCVLTVPSFGAGNTASSAVIHGFYQ